MPRTKIVCTLGPASDDEGTITAFAEAGMAVARLNFSHGTYDDHARRIETVRRVASRLGRSIAILADLQGPKLRVGLLPNPEGMSLVEGQVVTLAECPSSAEPDVIPLPHPEILRDVREGDRLLLDDGLLELRVVDCSAEVRAQVVAGGLLRSRKGVSLPHAHLQMPSVTDKDKADADFALKHGADFFALSFVRSAKDVNDLRAWLGTQGATTPIIAKIEKPEALTRIDEILEVSEGLMVARGDLGVEAPPEEVPIAQKRIILSCNMAGKPVITATQMLDSMIRNPRPTRAEASDVANAILDGTDAIMLSGETAVGRYVVDSVQTMARIAVATERSISYSGWSPKLLEEPRKAPGESGFPKLRGGWLPRAYVTGSGSVMDAIGQVACETATELGAKAIIASTVSGSTACRIARHRPVMPIVAPTPSEVTYRRLALVWGVEPHLVERFVDTDTMMVTVVAAARERGVVQDGDLVIITAGVPVGGEGLTNMLKVHRVGEEKGWR